MCTRTDNDVVVLKLGGSVLASDTSLPAAVSEVYRHLREGKRVIAVVSAIGETTDELLTRARAVYEQSDDLTLAALLATGEHTSAALVTLALRRAGIDATSRSVEQIGLIASGGRLDAEPVQVDITALHSALKAAAVVVVPGFLARLADGSPATLGRGGSDLTALFIGARIGAPVTLLKDVPGLFEWDPAIPGRRPRLFSSLTFDDALRLDGRIVQHKGLRFAKHQTLPFTVRGLNSEGGTLIGADRTALTGDPAVQPALRVGLIGLGTVGRGVAERLALSPSLARIEAVAVRDPARHARTAPAGVQLNGDAIGLATRADIDVLIDCCSDPAVSLAATRAALARGARVVTASKVLAGPHGSELSTQAERDGGDARWSAAVGGGVPVLEAAAALTAAGERVTCIRGVVNGTCNFVLDRLAEGVPAAEAVRSAQQRGLAEPDPSADLTGLDSARKLVVLAREVLGEELALDDVDRTGIDGLTPDVVAAVAEQGRKVRLVATVEHRNGKLRASVRPAELDASDPLASAPTKRMSSSSPLKSVPSRSSSAASAQAAGRPPRLSLAMFCRSHASASAQSQRALSRHLHKCHRSCRTHATYASTRVPGKSSPVAAFSSPLGCRPSVIATRRSGRPSIAIRHASILGIIPPSTTPRAFKSLHCATVSVGAKFVASTRTPGVSETRMNDSTASHRATWPAARSAFTFSFACGGGVDSSSATGAITGIDPASTASRSAAVSTRVTRPTCPRSCSTPSLSVAPARRP
ncbi:MAG: hypothetical protein QM783_18905 [Phycisphaerales bacterium]